MAETDKEDSLEARDYQLKLLEIAIERNTIIYLPTGSGKTFIAVMAIRQLSEPLAQCLSQGGKISIMLVNTVALVDQQSQYIRRFTPFRVGGYSGEMNVDGWNESKWQQEFDKHQVIVMTSQILLNIIQHSYISLSCLNLVIFDECHHGVSDHAMRQIMICLEKHLDLGGQLRIIGLTATLLNKNCTVQNALPEVYSLERTFRSNVATVDELRSVIGYATNPKEITITFLRHVLLPVEEEAIKCFKVLINILNKYQNSAVHLSPKKDNMQCVASPEGFDTLINLIKDTIFHITLFGAFGGMLAVIAHIIQLERIRRRYQNAKMAFIMEGVVTTFTNVKRIFCHEMNIFSDIEQIYKFSSEQIHQLIDVLREYKNTSTNTLCGLIFVHRRFTAKVLYNFLLRLSTVDPEFEFLHPDFVVGYNTNPFNDTREGLYNTKMHRKVLTDFKNHKVNILVATNVLEEGVDIPMCTLVIRFDIPLDYRSYIQSKGRARHKNSFFYTMVEKSDMTKFDIKQKGFQDVEQLLNNYLIGQNEKRNISQMAEECLELETYFVNGPGSAQVTTLSAISLLSRYCLSLPSDKYTTYSPTWFIVQEQSKGVKFVIDLPKASPLWKESIEGPFMFAKKTAKRAAALNACILLHQTGELDNNLLPKAYNIVDEDISYFFNHWPDFKEKGAGVLKKRRLHFKKVAEACQGTIKHGERVYLHIINLEPLFDPNDDVQRGFYDLYSSETCFGIISAKSLPNLCKFSVYISSGEIEVDIKVNQRSYIFTEQQIIDFKAFTVLIYKDILNILKSFLICNNNDDTMEQFLIVPVRKNDSIIDFDLIRDNKQLVERGTEPSEQDKLKLVVSEETYFRKIVTPWYRPIDKDYLVVKVCSHLDPNSTFPSDDFDTYTSYFHDKYRTNVLNSTQPLLLVKGLSKRLKYLNPLNSIRKRNKERSYDTMEEHLIPELCFKQEFPAELWIQASLLPSILYRLSSLLGAEELRRKIVNETGLGKAKLDKCSTLTVDKHLLKIKEPVKPKQQKRCEDDSNIIETTVPDNVMKQIIQEFAYKKLESEFPWLEKDEPVDIERHLDVTLMDIQYYDNFISQKVQADDRLHKNSIRNKTEYPAITYDQEFSPSNIKLLTNTTNELGPELVDIYKALSTAKCNDIINLERSETLGDSFLKISVSLFILLKFPKYNEGKATALKSRLISNKNLYQVAIAKALIGYLRNCDFEPTSDWKPPGFCVPFQLKLKIDKRQMSPVSLFYFAFTKEEQISGILNEHSTMEFEEEQDDDYESIISFFDQQVISDKSIADSVEALIGVFFESCGFNGALKLLSWLNIIPSSENVENLLNYKIPNPILSDSNDVDVDLHIPSWKDLERRLGYKFKNRAYLLQAVTHASYSPNRITDCYQNLEFLGDAVLDFLITCYIYENCKDLNPGEVTDLRSALVNNITFASFTVRYGFHKFLLFSNSTLLDYINNFVDYQESQNHAINDKILILLEEGDLHLSEHVDVPKVLGDIFEALAGAVFLDSEMSFEIVWNVFYPLMWKEIKAFKKNVPKNTVRLLYETVGAHPQYQKSCNTAEDRTMVGLDFMQNGTKKRVYGFGENKSLAKKAAAKIALRLLQY